MDIQVFITMGIGIVAIVYILFRFTRQLSETEKSPKCEHCPIIEVDMNQQD